MAAQVRRVCARKAFAQLNDAEQLRIQRVIAVRRIEAVVAVRPTDDETESTELAKLILNSVQANSLIFASSCT